LCATLAAAVDNADAFRKKDVRLAWTVRVWHHPTDAKAKPKIELTWMLASDLPEAANRTGNVGVQIHATEIRFVVLCQRALSPA
jgi:hypothetical protein